jgi:uncharacterized protein
VHIDGWQTLAGGAVGILVGLTGMGGGALLTPILILLFGINPGTAVSSDLLTSLVMRPFGGAVHARRRTVSWPLVAWLSAGSVPAGFCAVLITRALGSGAAIDHDVQLAIGWALVVAASALVAKAVIGVRRPESNATVGLAQLKVRPLPTLAVGVAGGLMVGMTSVGSGSLMMVLLLALYPRIAGKNLVGTDLVQAIPLIAAATLGHAIYGHISLAITGSLLIGGIPGAYIGARMSARAPDGVIRPILTVVLFATALKLLGVPTYDVLGIAGALLASGVAVWAFVVRRDNHHRAPKPELADSGYTISASGHGR